MKKSLVTFATAAVLGLGSTVASAAPVYLDFQIDQSSAILDPSGLLPKFETIYTADKFSGDYSEKVVINGTGGVQAAAYATFTSLAANQGTTSVASGIGTFYRLYALFTSTAQVTSSTNFTGLFGNIELWLDNGADTNFTLANGVGGPTVSAVNQTGDVKLATSSLMRAGGSSYGSIVDPKAFEFIFDAFSLTTEGASYFVSPNPFYMSVQVNGNILGLAAAPGVYDVTGTAEATFTVPEPATLALMGLALAGAGAVSRRRKQA